MEWGFVLVLVLALPFVVFWPALFWGGAIVGLYRLIRDWVHRRNMADQRKITGMALVKSAKDKWFADEKHTIAAEAKRHVTL